jgi:hypothetical protein
VISGTPQPPSIARDGTFGGGTFLDPTPEETAAYQNQYGVSGTQDDPSFYDEYGNYIGTDGSQYYDGADQVEYDEYGNPIYPAGSDQYPQYDEYGNPIEYDEYGNPIFYDEYGNQIFYDEYGNMIQYDEYGNIIQYDQNGNPVVAEPSQDPNYQQSQQSLPPVRNMPGTAGSAGADIRL